MGSIFFVLVVVFGGVSVGNGIVVLLGVGGPHQPYPKGGNYNQPRRFYAYSNILYEKCSVNVE